MVGRLSKVFQNLFDLGCFLFVAYEICLSLSIGYSQTNRQAIEVGMVNYLWPTFTMVAAILFNQQKANFLIIHGFVVSLLGICWVLGGEQGFDLIGMANNIQQNPLSYGLAFLGTLLWAAYCTLTARIAQEQMELLYSLFWFRSCFGLNIL